MSKKSNSTTSTTTSSLSITTKVALFAIVISQILHYGPGFKDVHWSTSEPATVPLSEQQHQPQSSSNFQWITFDGGKDGKTELVGKLYTPQQQQADDEQSSSSSRSSYPVIILAHGLGLMQDCSLEDKFVNAFVAEGVATLTFDYATFGYSAGIPRHVVDPNQHIQDIKSAIGTLHERSKQLNIDSTRMALWGTSLGGGHVLSIAFDNNNNAKDSSSASLPIPEIKVVIAQVPHLASGLESVLGTVKSDPITYIPALVQTLAGMIKGAIYAINNQAWYLPLHGPPGSSAAMQNLGDDEGYGALCRRHGSASNDDDASSSSSSSSSFWKNGMTALSGIRIMLYRPLSTVLSSSSSSKTTDKTLLPSILMIAAENDTLCPARYVQQVADHYSTATTTTTSDSVVDAGTTKPQLVEYVVLENAGHFDIYQDRHLQTALDVEINFLKKNLFQ